MKTILKYRPIMYIEIWKKNYTYISDILWRKMGYKIQQMSQVNYICLSVKH